jgi:KDO2-lipid IV(A) lauroyltransferase
LSSRLGRDAGWAAIRLIETMVRGRGPGYALRVGRALGRLVWPLMGGRRRLSLENARVVLGGLPEAERRRLVRESIIRSVANWPELVSHVHDRLGRIATSVVANGREHLDRALARGRGAIAATIHLGNFALIGAWMARAGYDFQYLIRFPHEERFARRLRWLSRVSGIKLIGDRPRRECLRGLLRALDRNGVVCVLLDQSAMRTGAGADLRFFGRPYRAFTGVTSLALKTGAAVVPVRIGRTGGPRHRLDIEPEFVVERSGRWRADVRVNTQRLLGLFEGWVEARPQEWWWPNRRWRTA